jgi:hypothetical protein
MEKDIVIKVRDKLKAGKNWPLIIYIDNTFRLINESNVLQFTKWDDDNGILYSYSLTDPRLEKSPSNIGGTISLFAVAYEHIQAMEIVRMNLKDLGDSIDSLDCIKPEWKERIIKRFETALNPDVVNLTARDINKAMGVINGQKALNDNDEYYENRFTQSFAETVYTNRFNNANEKNKIDNTINSETTESTNDLANTETIEPDVENTEGE